MTIDFEHTELPNPEHTNAYGRTALNPVRDVAHTYLQESYGGSGWVTDRWSYHAADEELQRDLDDEASGVAFMLHHAFGVRRENVERVVATMRRL